MGQMVSPIKYCYTNVTTLLSFFTHFPAACLQTKLIKVYWVKTRTIAVVTFDILQSMLLFVTEYYIDMYDQEQLTAHAEHHGHCERDILANVLSSHS